jgi:hypothetical protein
MHDVLDVQEICAEATHPGFCAIDVDADQANGVPSGSASATEADVIAGDVNAARALVLPKPLRPRC